MGHVTGPCAEHVHQCEMFAILQYVGILVINPRKFSPFARQPALTWHAVCTQIDVRGLNCYHPSMKWIRSPSTELRHFSAVYIMCPSDLDLFFSPKLGHVTRRFGSHGRFRF